MFRWSCSAVKVTGGGAEAEASNRARSGAWIIGGPPIFSMVYREKGLTPIVNWSNLICSGCEIEGLSICLDRLELGIEGRPVVAVGDGGPQRLDLADQQGFRIGLGKPRMSELARICGFMGFKRCAEGRKRRALIVSGARSGKRAGLAEAPTEPVVEHAFETAVEIERGQEAEKRGDQGLVGLALRHEVQPRAYGRLQL